ncbi:MFS transporter [Clostridium paraputrificum]|uniref:MFS transporter n=1 Tax=Clostridium TaxID=1485 RepID=UPI003D34C105
MRQKSMKYVIVLTLITHILLSMAHPVTPMLIKENNLPSYLFGIFFAAMSIGNFIFSPIWGKLSDSNGRIGYLILGIIGYGVSQIGFGYSSNPIIIVIFRFIGGASVISFLTVILAYIADITDEKGRLKGMTYYAAASTVGSALGSLLGGLIGNSNYRITFLTQFIMSIVISLLYYFFLEETINKQSKKEKDENKKIKKSVVINSKVILVMTLVSIFYFATTSYNSSINYFIESVLNLPPKVNGIFLAIAGIMGFFTNLLITPLLGKEFGELKSLKISLIAMALFIGLATFSSSNILFLLFIIIFVCSASVTLPLLQNIISKIGKKNNGQIAGIQNSCRAVGMIIGSLYSGFIFDIGNKLPFLTASLVIIIGIIYMSFISKKEDII